jgi:hypothetical protein
MSMVLDITAKFLLVSFLSYMVDIEAACGLFDAGSLSGLIGAFITGRLSALGGSIAGALLAWPSTRSPASP